MYIRNAVCRSPLGDFLFEKEEKTPRQMQMLIELSCDSESHRVLCVLRFNVL